MKNMDYEKIFKVNAFFLGIYCLYVILSLLFSFAIGFYSIVPTSFIILGIIPYAYIKSSDYNLREIFSLKLPSLKHILLIIPGAILVLIISQFIANIAVKLYELAGKLPEPQVKLQGNVITIIAQFLITGLFVPIMEEAFFRGFLLGAYRRLKIRHYVIISGILFGLFHLQFHIVLGTIFAGIIWGYFVKYSGSIVSAIIAHVIFNSTTLAVMYAKNDIERVAAPKNLETLGSSGILIFIFLVSLACVALYYILRALKNSYDNLQDNDEIKTWSIEAIAKREHEKMSDKDRKALPEYSVFDKIRSWSPIGFFVVLVVIGSVILFTK